MSRLTPPQPVSIWTDDDGHTWYEYSYHEIAEYTLQKLIRGLSHEPLKNNRSSTGERRCNIPLDIV